MAHVDEEIASQPACWRRAVESAPLFEISLHRRGHRVAVVGCGTSWFVAQSYAVLRELAGHGETDAFAASQFPAGRRYDRIMAITRSGTTTEVLDLLAALPRHTPTTVITGVPDAPVVGAWGRACLPRRSCRSITGPRGPQGPRRTEKATEGGRARAAAGRVHGQSH